MITLRHRKFGPALTGIGVALACLLVGPATASASNVDCWGKVTPAATQTDLTYGFQCSEPIKGFSLVSSLEVGEFSTTADVFDPTTKAPIGSQTFGCEGSIPSDGFGCTGTAQDPNLITGTFAIDSPRCVKRRNKLRVWISTIDQTGSVSGPQGLVVPPRCPGATKQRRHHKQR